MTAPISAPMRHPYPPIRPKEVKDLGQYVELTYDTEAGNGKKWGVGLASGFITGLGQAINGEWGKGFAFFLSAAAIGGLSQVIAIQNKNRTISIIGSIASFGIGIWSIIDAVKNAKSEIKQIVPKNAAQLNYYS